jgi:hypothetical protein
VTYLSGKSQESHENFSQNSRSVERDMGLGTSEYDADVPVTSQQHSIVIT